MKKKCLELAPKVLFPWFSSYLLFVVIYLAFPRQFGIEGIYKSHLFVGAFVAALVTFFCVLDGLKKIWSLLLVGTLGLMVHLLVGFSKMMQFWQEYGSWLMGRPGEHEEWFLVYMIFQCVAIGIFSGIGWILLYRFRQWSGIFGLLVFAGILLGAVLKFSMPTPGVAACLTFALFLCSLWQLGRGRDERNAQFMLFMAPLFVGMVILLGLTPSSRQPYSWPITRGIVKQLGTRMEGMQEAMNRFMYNFHSDRLGEIGIVDSFAERAQIQGNISQGKQVLMEIQRDSDVAETLYLVANAWTEFDGREWKKEVENLNESQLMDTRQFLYATYRYTDYWGDCLKGVSLQVQYKNFHSANAFLPVKARKVSEVTNTVGKNQKLGYGSEYTADYVVMNLHHPIFTQLIMESNQLEEDDNAWLFSGTSGNSKGSLKELNEYIESVKQEYTTTIDLSQEMCDWKEQIYLDYQQQLIGSGLLEEERDLSIYEKLLALEEALAKMDYNLSPGNLPDKVRTKEDFLQYFCLEEKEGYCLHFATALALLAQSEGMPARLCQGFCVPMGNRKQVEVTADQSHAWPEVYFEGIGWIPFEPTPGYAGERYQPWKVSEHLSMAQQKANQALVWDAYLKEMEAKHRAEEEARAKEAEEARQKKEETQALLRGEKNEEILMALTDMIWKIVIGIVVFFFLSMIFLLVYVLWQRERFRRMEPEEKFTHLSQRNLYLLGLLGLHKKESETLEEFMYRLQKVQLPGIWTLQCMEENAYAGKIMDAEKISKVFEERKQILQEMKKYKGKKMFLILEKIYIASLTKYI